MKIPVYSLLVAHRYGASAEVFSTPAQRDRSLRSWVDTWWHVEIAGVDPPADEDQRIREYFERMRDKETYRKEDLFLHLDAKDMRRILADHLSPDVDDIEKIIELMRLEEDDEGSDLYDTCPEHDFENASEAGNDLPEEV